MNLDEAAARLYGLVPGDFTAERTALARAAKESGDAALARDIGRLRRPTVAAWAVNQATRAHPEELAELLDLGTRLRAAWQGHDSAALAELTRARSPLTSRLARLIREHAERAGQPLGGAGPAEVEQTLDAATVDEQAAEEVRRGCLVRPLSYSGFTPAPTAPARTSRASQAKPASTARPGKKEPGKAAEEEDNRRRDLEQALAAAEREAAEAERGHGEWRAELEDANREHARASARVEETSRRLAEAKHELSAAVHRLDVAERDERRAGRTAAAARRKAEEAADRLRTHK